MTSHDIFTIWAPPSSPWSRWVKPVLFAYVESAMAQLPVDGAAADVSWAPPSADRAAMVLDLPGAEGVLTGLALAAHGFRPVPLYNAVPLPLDHFSRDPVTQKMVAAVQVVPIVCALRKGAEVLAQLNLPADAPPAFLLDADRGASGRKMEEDEFDNRSVSFTTDFPTANFLVSRGIRKAIVVEKDRDEPQIDLAHTLCRWQDAGFQLEHKRLDRPDLPGKFKVSKPLWYRAMFQRALARLGLRRSGIGGFGAWVQSGG